MCVAKCLLLMALIVSGLYSPAQDAFHPLKKDASRETALLDGISARYNQDVSGLSGSNKKYIADIYKERYELIKGNFTDNGVITDTKSAAYLATLCNEVIRANPTLDKSDLRIMFSKAWWANAASMGEGSIFFNIGLFHRLESEAQAVFVICHELSHYYLNHGNNSIQRYVNTVYSDEFQKQLKAIQKSEYGRNRQAEALAKGLSFRTRRHSREFEQAADSMAIELMKNTAYDLNDALSCLALLDSADKDKYSFPIELSKRFDFAAYHFKPSWTRSDVLMFAKSADDGKMKDEADSLKTHPDCQKRIGMLKEIVKKYNRPSNRRFIVNEQTFRELRSQFDYEIIQYCFENNKVSRSLYYCLEMLALQPNNVYLHTMVGKCLNEIYARQKAHELGKITDLPGSDYEEEYNTLLHLTQNLRLPEVAALAYYYMQEHAAAFGNDREYAAVWQVSKANFSN